MTNSRFIVVVNDTAINEVYTERYKTLANALERARNLLEFFHEPTSVLKVCGSKTEVVFEQLA